MEAQPYRRGSERGPSQVLETMMAGRAQGGQALMAASNNQKASRRPGRRSVMVPRNRPPRSFLEDMGLGPAHPPPGGEEDPTF